MQFRIPWKYISMEKLRTKQEEVLEASKQESKMYVRTIQLKAWLAEL